jgi:hypothetical protein
MSAARTLATLFPQELKPVEEPGPEPTIVVYDLPPGSTPVTHRAGGRSSEDTSGDETLPEAAKPAAEESQTQNPAWFFYKPTDDIKSSVRIGSWEPARATDNTGAAVTVRVVTTDERETADRWQAELAAGRISRDGRRTLTSFVAAYGRDDPRAFGTSAEMNLANPVTGGLTST